MRAIGHFLIFVAFFLVFAGTLGLLILGATVLRSTVALLLILPAMPGLYVLYTWSYRHVQGRLRQKSARTLARGSHGW
ncbi:hypothetical protein GF314_04985 [bacterium]|nr:hypothetical protein [bacterium]